MLRELDGRKKKKKKELWDTALNDEGIEVTGEKMKLAWKEAYRKLGAENLDKEEFDNEFAKDVDEDIEEMIKESTNNNSELGEQITLDEVQKVVKRLKKRQSSQCRWNSQRDSHVRRR
ncbi:MAG: hypothetical protein HRU26_04045 [Psychroserpens sp.]|nr:hypothetical protein [Psychroserpens sp.]